MQLPELCFLLSISVFSGEKIADCFFFLLCCSHTGRFELMYCSQRSLRLYSTSPVAETVLQYTVLVERVMLQLV